MPAPSRPFFIFWIAVTLDVFALGVAWSAWKALDGSVFVLVVAAAATLVGAAATLVAGRVLTVVSRSARDRAPNGGA